MPRKTKTQPQAELAQPEQTEVRIILNQATEIGTSGLKEQGGFVAEAYNSQLYYPQAYTIYNKIRRSMPEMVMIRRAFTSWARSVSPIVELPDEPTDDDKRYQDFIQTDFDNMEGGFTNFIDTLINHVPFFGFGWFDVVPGLRAEGWTPPPYMDYKGQSWADDWRSEENDGYIGIRRLAWRDVGTFNGWEFDGRKKVIAMLQQDYPKPPVRLPKEHGLHFTFGDPNNPEGSTPLEPVWRLERIKYGLEMIQGIGYEHAAGHLKARKTEKGTLSTSDKTLVRAAARAILTAQEGNYALFPYGIDGDVIDIPFQAAGSLLEAIKHYSILTLSVYMMQFVALNTMTNTGALASQVDSTQIGIFTFNAMLDGFAAQYDEQVGKRLFAWNKAQFPNITKRPKIKFTHIENNVALGDLGNFLRAINGIIPLGNDDAEALRQRTGWMPKNNPAEGDELKPATPAPSNQPGDNQPMNDNNQAAVDAKDQINQALFVTSRARRGRQ